MRLELKHLLPYALYKVNMYWEDLEGNINDPWILNIYNADFAIENQNKPILRPLSDLTKEEYRRLFYGNPLDYKIDELPYKTFTKLLELHFDVFHLIPQGLAIDVNKL